MRLFLSITFGCIFAYACLLPLRIDAPERPGVEFKIFQFPHDKIPRIDGFTDDWDIVDGEYIIGSNQLTDNKASGDLQDSMNPDDLQVQVRVGWVKGLNRLYFLYEAYDNDWNMYYKRGDIFEPVIDADLSGGPYITNPQLDNKDTYFMFKGVHAQNYHIFTPPGEGRDWALIPGCNPWIRKLPYANYAYSYDFKDGESEEDKGKGCGISIVQSHNTTTSKY